MYADEQQGSQREEQAELASTHVGFLLLLILYDFLNFKAQNISGGIFYTGVAEKLQSSEHPLEHPAAGVGNGPCNPFNLTLSPKQNHSADKTGGSAVYSGRVAGQSPRLINEDERRQQFGVRHFADSVDRERTR
jgi:hypothetical protein